MKIDEKCRKMSKLEENKKEDKKEMINIVTQDNEEKID